MELVPTSFTSLFPSMYSIFELGYKFAEVLWAGLNSPISNFLGSDVSDWVPIIIADATVLENLFGPTLFAVLILKIVYGFMPFS